MVKAVISSALRAPFGNHAEHNISLDDLTKNKEKYGANSANFVPARLKDRVASSALVKENKEICRALAAKGAKGKKIRREFGANRHM